MFSINITGLFQGKGNIFMIKIKNQNHLSGFLKSRLKHGDTDPISKLTIDKLQVMNLSYAVILIRLTRNITQSYVKCSMPKLYKLL